MVKPSTLFAALIFGLSFSGTAASAQDLEDFVLGSWEKEEPGWFDAECRNESGPAMLRYGVPVRGILTFTRREDGLHLIFLNGVVLFSAPDMDPVSIQSVSFRPAANGVNIMMDGHPEFPNGVTVFMTGPEAAIQPNTLRLVGVNNDGESVNDLYVRCS